MYYLLYAACALFHQTAAMTIPMEADKGTPNATDHFFYFAYGSNLLKERLQLHNPSATFVKTGSLKDHAVRFGYFTQDFNGSNSWHGGVATIQQSKGEDVWGVIWRMDLDNIVSLDKQEGVDRGMYSPLNVSVDTDDGAAVCRSYQMNNFTPQLPSPQYKQVLCLGAKQNGLPLDYIKKLDAVETNGYCGPTLLDDIKGLKPVGKTCEKHNQNAKGNAIK